MLKTLMPCWLHFKRSIWVQLWRPERQCKKISKKSTMSNLGSVHFSWRQPSSNYKNNQLSMLWSMAQTLFTEITLIFQWQWLHQLVWWSQYLETVRSSALQILRRYFNLNADPHWFGRKGKIGQNHNWWYGWRYIHNL